MLLSIVMMVKNEEKFLERTLTSFNELRNKIDSELIILDTGSTDKSVNIAKKYTDKVYFEQWNDDFSSMRNKSISYACGEWLLIVDADEVLVEYDKLIEFLNSDKCKKYSGAYARIKNIKSNDNKKFNYANIRRIFKNQDIIYEGRIHEQPNVEDNLYKDLVLLEHYGYIFEDEEDKIKKLKRNEKLLLQELKDNPDDIYTNYQIAKNLLAEGKLQESIYYMEICIKKSEENNNMPGIVYTNLALAYIASNQYKKAEKLCEKYILKDKYNIDIYFYLGKARVELGKIELAIKSLERYVYLSENYELSTQSRDILIEYMTENYLIESYIYLIELYYKECNYNKTIEMIFKLENKDRHKVYLHLFNCFEKNGEIDKIYEYYKKNINSKEQKNIFYYNLELFLINVDNNTYKKITNDFSIESSYYGYLNKLRDGNEVNKDKIKSILSKKESVIYGDLIGIALSKNLDLIDLLIDLDSIWIEKYLSFAIKSNKSMNVDLYKYIKSLPITLNIDYIRIYIIIFKIVLSSNGISLEKYKEIYYIYNMYYYRYSKFIYNDMSNECIIKYSMSEEERFNIVLRNLIEYKDKNSIDYINELRQALKEYPNYKKIIEILINNVENIKSYNDEYYVTKNKFIQIIVNCIESNDIKNAKVLIDQYYEINGKDSEILNVHGVLCIMQKDLSKANRLFTKAISLNVNNEDIIYNIEYLNSGEL